jgi:cell division protein FtsB
MARMRTPSLSDRIRSMPLPSARQAGILAVLAIVVILSGVRLAGLADELKDTRGKRAELEAKRAELEQRHRDLETQSTFVADPDHLEQELRARYNYKKPGEQVIIVVPPASSTTSTAP